LIVDFEFIDYSAHYYNEIALKPVPPKRGGKFVQIRGDGTEFIVLSLPKLSAYHANIAEMFFLSKGIAGSYNPKRDHYRVRDKGWLVAGGGVWEIDETACRIRLSGTSMAYGNFDPDGLGGRLRAVSSLSGFEVKINA
jgi:hypothetical protein